MDQMKEYHRNSGEITRNRQRQKMWRWDCVDEFHICFLSPSSCKTLSVLTHAHTVLKSGKLNMNHKIKKTKKAKQKNRIVKTKIHHTLFMKYFGRHSSAFICLLLISHPCSTFPSFLSFRLQFCQSYFIAYRFCIISLCRSCPPFLPQSISLLFWSRLALRWTRVMPYGKVTEWKKDRGRERETGRAHTGNDSPTVDLICLALLFFYIHAFWSEKRL